MTDTEERLRDAVRDAMLARTAYWYNAVTAPDDLREQIEQEVDEADAEYQSALDALIRYVRAEARASKAVEMWQLFDRATSVEDAGNKLSEAADAAEAELAACKEAK